MAPLEKKIEILIVDDDEGHIELVRRNLQRSGITNHITDLHSGDAALDYVFGRGQNAAQPPRSSDLLILLDINMPGAADGIEVLRRVKAAPETRGIPIIMLTTTDDPREISRCYDLGCNIYITKPVDPAAFVEAVKRLGLFISIVAIPPSQETLP